MSFRAEQIRAKRRFAESRNLRYFKRFLVFVRNGILSFLKISEIRRGTLFAVILHASSLLFSSPAYAQFLHLPAERIADEPHNPLVASYALTSIPPGPPDTLPMAFTNSNASAPGHKSGFLAAALSLVIPGLGEYYIGDHVWRGMIFTGMEAGLWIGMIHWQQQYNSYQNAFYNFSTTHFSSGKYARHLDTLLLSDTQWARTIYPTHRADSGNIPSINRAEAALDSLKQIYPSLPDTDYTHRLVDPNVDFQQYNEMISKYWQYISGWDAISNWSTASFMRADAQHQADIANDFLFGIILNHILSAVDAALLARDHDSPIHLHGDLIEHAYPDGTMGFIPTASIEYRF